MENGELLLNGYRDSVWDDENVLEIVMLTAQHREMYLMPQDRTLENG